MKRRRGSSGAPAGSVGLAISVCVLLAVTGCSSTASSDAGEVERGAQGTEVGAVLQDSDPSTQASEPEAEVEAAADEAVADGAVADDAVAAGAVGSVYRGVRMCVKNERTTVDGRRATVSMQFKDGDGDRGERIYLLPTVERCMDTSGMVLRTDLVLMYTDARTLEFIGKNMFIGAVAYVGPGDGWFCALATDEGASETYDNGDARYIVSRLNDSKNFKEYKLVIQDSQGKLGSCLGERAAESRP